MRYRLSEIAATPVFRDLCFCSCEVGIGIFVIHTHIKSGILNPPEYPSVKVR
jgi:hypothetical protein